MLVWNALRATDASQSESGNGDIQDAERRAAKAYIALASAQIFYKSQPLVERLAGAILGASIPAALGYAEKITSGLMQVAVFGFAVAALPLMSHDMHRRDHSKATARLQFALIGTFASAIAVVAFGLISAEDLVRVFYQRGAFSIQSAGVTEAMILCSLPSIAFAALAGPLTSAWYAANRIPEVVVIGVCGFIVGTATTFLLSSLYRLPRYRTRTATGYTLTFVVFAGRLRVVLPMWSWKSVLRAEYGRAIAATVIAVSGSSFGIHLALDELRFSIFH